MNKELLFSVTKKDFNFQFFRCGGHGGQKQNKTSSGVRIIHLESGAKGESREERHQYANKELAFKRLVKTKEFNDWLRHKASKIIYGVDKAKEKTEKMMDPKFLKIETKKDNKWIEDKNDKM